MKRGLGTFALAALVLIAGCKSSKSKHEISVRPGINKAYENANIADWTERFESESREIWTERERIVADIGARKGMTVADIGAGTGFFTMMLAREVGATGHVYSVDITPEFVEHIRQMANRAVIDHIETVLCKEDSVELPRKSIDIAFICDVYHHFEYPRSSMKSLFRAMKDEGEVVVIDFRRVEGVSRKWVLDHVRAGMETVIEEILSDGFELVSKQAPTSKLEENYFLRFRKPD